MPLQGSFAEVRKQIQQEESTKKGGLTPGKLLALTGYDTNRVGVGELPSLHLTLQQTGYFDFIASSVDARSLPARTLALSRFIPRAQPLQGFPNGVAICLILQSSDGKLIFGRRSDGKVGPRRGEWDVSVVEGLHPTHDFDSATGRVDLTKAAIRGLREELGYLASSDEVELLGFGVDLEFYQWNVIGLVRARASALEIMQKRIAHAKDRHEYRYLHPVEAHPLEVLRFLWASRMWSSGLAASHYGLVRLQGIDAVNAAVEEFVAQ